MGFFQDLGRTFGLTKSKDQGQAPDRERRVTPLQTDEGKLLSKILKDRIAGLGTGFSKDLTDPAIASFAKRQRRDLEDITIPGISAGASARGVGRSTISVGQEARERGRTGESIAERIANLGISSENLKAQQVSEATGRFQNLVGSETQAKNAEIQAQNFFQQAEFLRQRGFREAADKAQQDGLKLLTSIGVGAIAGGAGILPGTAGSTMGQGVIQGITAGVGGDFGLFKPAPTFATSFPTSPTNEVTPGANVELARKDAAIDALNIPQEEKDFMKQAIRILK